MVRVARQMDMWSGWRGGWTCGQGGEADRHMDPSIVQNLEHSPYKVQNPDLSLHGVESKLISLYNTESSGKVTVF